MGTPAKRIGYIDIAKGIAMTLVVMGHVLFFDLYGNSVWESSKLMRFIYAFHVPFFFFLSGLVSVTDLQWSQIPKDIWKRFRFLIIPFVVIGSIYSILTHQDLSFIFNEYKYGYWYLWVLFVFYMFSYPIAAFKSMGWANSVFLYVPVVIIWIVAEHLIPELSSSIKSTFSLSLIIHHYPYFLMGHFVKRMRIHELCFGNSYILLCAIILWSLEGHLHFRYSNYLTTYGIILVLMNVCRKIDYNNLLGKKSLSFLGINTLYIYVFHYFIIDLMKTDIFMTFLPSHSNIIIDLLITIVPTMIAIAFSIGIKELIKNDKIIMRLLFGR